MSQRNIDRFVGGYQIIAGFVGIFLGLVLGFRALNSGTSPAPLLIMLVIGAMMAVFGGVVLAGVLLLEGHPAGRILSTGVQVLQVPILSAASVHWLFFAGAYLGLVWFGDQTRLILGLKANLEFGWAGAPQITGFGINVIPLIVLGLLWRPPALLAVSREPSAGPPRPAA
ncbi:MAG: hypothetical protein ACJ79K_17200 [Gemmatimonadaceae bacterium]